MADWPVPLPLQLLPADQVLGDLLAVSLTGVIYYTPVCDPAGTDELVDFRFEYLNPAAQRMLGMPEVPTLTYLQQWPHSREHGTFAFHVEAFRSGETREYNINYQAGGYDNYYRLAAHRSGPGLLVSFTDTADQPRSPVEIALREAQAHEQAARAETEAQRQQLQEVLQQAPVAIALLEGPDYHIALANPAVCEIWTRPESQLLGRPLLEAMPELRGQRVDTLLNGVLQTGEPFFGTELPFQLLRHNRPETIYFNFVYQPQRNAQGVTTGVLVVASDVTAIVTARQRVEAQERLTAELNEELAAANEEIRANNEELLRLNQGLETRIGERTAALLLSQQAALGQQQRLEQLFMQAPAAICILNGPDLVYELVNPGYEALFPGHHQPGQAILEALPEIADHAVYHTFRQVYATGHTHAESGILIPLGRPEDGVLEDRYFNYIQQARYKESGQIDGVIFFAFEVTEQVRARQQAQLLAAELTLANEQLTRTNADLDNFIYTASHDLKAPISNLEGLVHLLREELPPLVLQSQYVAPTLARMLDSVERFQRTIDHLTEVSKLQQAHAPVTSSVDLADIIEAVCLDLAPLLRNTRAQLSVDVSHLPAVRFSEKNLRSVVYNLLSNALKYRHPDRRPHIDVRAHVRPDYTILEVHDNGLGLAEHQLPRLFGMFQRFHDHVEGTGIGLYMVKRMVENAGGRLEVHSQLGAGTTFFIFLPQQEESLASPSQS